MPSCRQGDLISLTRRRSWAALVLSRHAESLKFSKFNGVLIEIGEFEKIDNVRAAIRRLVLDWQHEGRAAERPDWSSTWPRW